MESRVLRREFTAIGLTLLAVFLAGALGLPEILSLTVDGRPFPIVWSIIGGALLVAPVLL